MLPQLSGRDSAKVQSFPGSLDSELLKYAFDGSRWEQHVLVTSAPPTLRPAHSRCSENAC